MSGIFDIAGKSAVVTGGAMGIGFAIAHRLAEAGANVVVADRDGKAAVGAVERLAGLSGRAIPISIDVGEDDAGSRMIDACCESFESADILVNNAGVYPYVSICELEPADFDRVVRVNLRGLTLASKAAALRMREQGNGGAIINIASFAGLTPKIPGAAAYSASKAGVLAMTRSMALELAPYAIRVNAVAPGAVATEGSAAASETIAPDVLDAMIRMSSSIPLGRVATPDDVAKVVLFLTTPAADYITGATILVDGGISLT